MADDYFRIWNFESDSSIVYNTLSTYKISKDFFYAILGPARYSESLLLVSSIPIAKRRERDCVKASLINPAQGYSSVQYRTHAGNPRNVESAVRLVIFCSRQAHVLEEYSGNNNQWFFLNIMLSIGNEENNQHMETARNPSRFYGLGIQQIILQNNHTCAHWLAP